jgi:acetyl esterase
MIGGDSRRIAVSGDSAGANIATVLTLLVRDRSGPRVVAQWLMYPTVSNKMDTESWAKYGDTNFPTRTVITNVIAAYVPKGTSPYSALVAPLWANHSRLPPALVQVGELDPLRDENVAYAKALKAAGVDATAIVYPGQKHGFMQFFKDKANNPEGEKAIDRGAEFLRAAFR